MGIRNSERTTSSNLTSYKQTWKNKYICNYVCMTNIQKFGWPKDGNTEGKIKHFYQITCGELYFFYSILIRSHLDSILTYIVPKSNVSLNGCQSYWKMKKISVKCNVTISNSRNKCYQLIFINGDISLLKRVKI